MTVHGDDVMSMRRVIKWCRKVQKWLYIDHNNHFSEANTTKMDVNASQVKMTVENWLVTIQD